ncbi:MAG: hypothetical protein WC284_18725 [Candidimonas sp.]
MVDRFTLPVIGQFEPTSDATYVCETRGWLSSMWAAYYLSCLLGVDAVDAGTWLTPIRFFVKGDDLESLRQLLEDELQENKFDRNQSAIVIVHSH